MGAADFSDRYARWAPAKGRKARGRPMLWPVYAWKMVYPDVQGQSHLNLFQYTLLSLIRAGERDIREIASMMALDQELVLFIISSQLQPNGWLESGLTLTAEGERLLREDARRSEGPLRVGYAFQDAVTGNWLPRFTDSIEDIEPETRDRLGKPVFLVDRGEGKRETPFVMPFFFSPKFDDGVFDAYREYRRDWRVSANQQEADLTDIQIRRVDDLPIPLYVWVELYRDQSDVKPWLVSDPFRITKAASWLRRPLASVASGSSSVSSLIESIVDIKRNQDQTFEEWNAEVERVSAIEIESDFAIFKSDPLVAESLVQLLRQRARVVNRENKPQQEELRSLVIYSANLIEALLKRLLREWKLGDVWSFQVRHDLIKEDLLALNMSCINGVVLEKLSYQKKGKVFYAGKYGDEALNSLLAACLFSAGRHRSHPFNSIPEDHLDLARLVLIPEKRNKQAHASLDVVASEEAIEFCEFSLDWIKLFRSYFHG